ncbi:SDR family oxidoreductase [Nakamurella sp. A5-74]|uniref:SDR family oxidoreductase n=1 Tax=Nakamurella sp. A5-74 TaxID=3158264 RepID=A0AAU8DU63_9ACTN
MSSSASAPFSGKVAAITGGGSGIGLALAQSIARGGGSVLLAGRSLDKLRTAAATLRGPVEVLTLDVSDPGSGKTLVATAIERFAQLDIVVANAGVYLPGDVREIDPVAADALVRSNVSGVIATVAAAAAHLAAQGTGDILVTSSVSGHQAIHWEPVYSASKHAVQAFVRGVRRQLVGSGVRIGAVAPGVVLNDLWNATDERQREADVAAGLGMYSEDVAEAMVFMLTRPRHVQIRDLVILPVNQEI